MKLLNVSSFDHFRNGFSLIEMMISCCILVILLTISSPSFTKLLAKNERENKLSLLKTSLMFTRIFAVKNNVNVTICPLIYGQCIKEWNKTISIFVDFNSNQALDQEDYLIKEIEEITQAHTLFYPRSAITYRADASLDGFQSGSFIYCLPVDLNIKGIRISVSQAGRIRQRDTDKC